MNLFVIDPSRSVAKSSGKKTGPTLATKLLAATPGVPVSIRYGSFPELEMADDQPVLHEADFTVNKIEESPAGVVRLSGHIGGDDDSVEATVTIYKRYNRLALLCMSV